MASVLAESYFQDDEAAFAALEDILWPSEPTCQHYGAANRVEYVRVHAHRNTIEGYFSAIKRGINDVYHYVNAHHLKRYLAEVDFCYNSRVALGVDDTSRPTLALSARDLRTRTRLQRRSRAETGRYYYGEPSTLP